MPPDKENNLSSCKLWDDCGVLGELLWLPLYLPMKAQKDKCIFT